LSAASAHDARLLLIGVGIAGALFWVRWRVRLVLEDEYFEYVGPVFRRRVKWEEISRERSVLTAGYPTDRVFGSSVYGRAAMSRRQRELRVPAMPIADPGGSVWTPTGWISSVCY
jgi:hypothetical protein